MRDDDDFVEYMMFQETFGKGSGSSGSGGGCGCCCFPVLILMGIIGLIIMI